MRVFIELLVPTFLVHLTRALLITTLPLFVLSTLEESKTYVGIAVGAIGLGKVLSDIPAGILLGRIGARNLMLVCGCIVSMSAVLMMIASQNRSFETVVFAMVLCGAGESVGVISRLATVSDEVPLDQRGKVSAYLGGSARIAMAVGPLLSGLATSIYGNPTSVFALQAVLAALSVIVVFSTKTTSLVPVSLGSKPATNVSLSPIQIMKSLFHITVFILALQLVRECRKLLIPLASFGASLSVREVSVFTSISFTIDALFFPYAGKVMDGYGRIFTGILSVSIMSIGLLVVVPSASFFPLLLFAVITGIGNGLSSGIIVAFGADMAPKDDSKSTFLGYFRLFADVGELLGPLIVGIVVQFTSIPVMLNTIVSCGIVGCVWLLMFVADMEWMKTFSPPPKEMVNVHDEDDSPFS